MDKNVKVKMFKSTNSKRLIEFFAFDGWNHKLEGDLPIHQDMEKCLSDLDENLAAAFHVGIEGKENYSCTGISITEKGESKFVVLTGKVETPEGHVVGISSGMIEIPDNTQSAFAKKIQFLCEEAVAYFFDKKSAQGSLDMGEGPGNTNQEKEPADASMN